MAMTAPRATYPGKKWGILALLGTIYLVAFIDRVILALLIDPLKESFAISDTQMSLLIGFNFALFYCLVGIPMGKLADRINRRNLIVITAIVWVGCTAVSGMADSFWMLCVLRIGVAVGEAALGPSAISMIGDLFPPHQRARATSIYMAMGALGATGGYLLGGYIVTAISSTDMTILPILADLEPWRIAFFVAAAPAAVITLLFFLLVSEPSRTGDAPAVGHKFTMEWLALPWRPLLYLFIAGSIGQATVRGLVVWMPTYMHREFDWLVGQAGMAIGTITMVCGIGGMLLWPYLSEKWRQQGVADALPMTLIIGMATGAVLTILMTMATSGPVLLSLFGATMFFVMGTGVLLMVAVQHYVPSNKRGEFMAVCMLLTVMIADGLGPSLVPMAVSLLGGENASLHLGFAALAIAGPIGCCFALVARKGLRGIPRQS